MRQLFFQTHWHFWRWIRLASGAVFVGAYFFRYEPILLIMGIFFLYQALFNVSCAGGSCTLPPNSKSQDITLN